MPSFVTSLEPLRRRRIGCSIVLGVMAGLALLTLAQEPADSGIGAFLRMIPLGSESKGAVIPSFDSTGRRTSLITADVVRRVDDERLYAENLVLQMFNADPKNNVRLDLHTAFYHLSGVLRSMEHSRVTRPDFEIEGDSLIFDTNTNQGRMTGNIRMVIFDSSNFGGVEPAPSETQPAK